MLVISHSSRYLGYEFVNEGAISHFSLFQEGRAKEKESQGGSSVQQGKGWHEGSKSLGDSNILRHNARLGHGDQSGYSRNQPRRAVERQSLLDKKSLKKKTTKINQLQRDYQRENQSGLLLFLCALLFSPTIR